MRDDRFDSIAAFVQAARLASIHLAAAQLGASPATVSRRISRLEDQLKVRLLTRTTRHVALTEIGRTYLERCEGVLAALAEADLSIAEEKASRPSGRLRVTAPGAFGRRRLAPVFAAFAQAHPEVTLEALLTDERIDIVARDIDVAIRMADLEDSSLVARRIADNRRRLCAAPAYLRRHGTPRQPAELVGHDGLIFEPYGDAAAWTFTRGEERHSVLPRAMLLTNDAELVLQFALAGLGIAIMADFLAAEEFKAGRLIPLLPDFELPRSAVYALHISRRHVPLRIRAFIRFLEQELG